jgi:hypothetical protein
MKLTDEAIAELRKSCKKIEERTLPEEKCAHASTKCLSECLSIFNLDAPTPVSITFRVKFAEPVNKMGFARINNDGTMKMWTGDDPFANQD